MSQDFFEASSFGDIQTVSTLLKCADLDINAISRRNYDTALIHACRGGHYFVAKKLLKNGADPDITGHNGYTALMYSSILGDQSLTELLIKYGACLNAMNDSGETPLMLACINNREGIVEILIKFDADLNKKNPIDGSTALMYAIGYKNIKIVRFLIAHGADPSIENFKGFNSWFYLVMTGNKNYVDIVDFYNEINNIDSSSMNTNVVPIKRETVYINSPYVITRDKINLSGINLSGIDTHLSDTDLSDTDPPTVKHAVPV
jgi:ankyrin repeat protein